MLQRLAERFQNVVLGGLVLLISAVFILQFGGPQAEGCSGGAPLYAAKVYGTTISQGDFRAAYLLAAESRLYGFQSLDPSELKRQVLDALIERDLMARKARALGFRLSESEVLEALAKDCNMLVTTASNSTPGFTQHRIPIACKDKDGKFSVKNVVNFVEYRLRRSLKEFSEWQIDESLAERLAQTLMATVTISPSEAWAAYARENERAKIKYIRFSPGFYRGSLDPTDEVIAAWAKSHAQKLEKEYQAQKHRYTNLEPQVKSSHILIKAAADADPATREAAYAKAAQILKRVRKGEDFAALARLYSEDKGSARVGGSLGYNPRGRMVKAFDDVQFGMKIGDTSDIVETEFGFHIIKVAGKREGSIPVEQAKLELARDMYLDDAANQAAHAAAGQALAQLRANVKSMDELGAILESAANSDPLAPKIQETREFGRLDTPIPGPFNNRALVDMVLNDLSLDHPLPQKPAKLGNEWVVLKVESRQHASRDQFTTEEEQRVKQTLTRDAQRSLVTQYVSALRKKAADTNDLRINEKMINEHTDSAASEEDDS
ncbi:MAG: peptidylprolyl isomerase [Myxococcales bacterium]|nr:peptidylprolyl isomerase [Myxococcales bacterium]